MLPTDVNHALNLLHENGGPTWGRGLVGSKVGNRWWCWVNAKKGVRVRSGGVRVDVNQEFNLL